MGRTVEQPSPHWAAIRDVLIPPGIGLTDSVDADFQWAALLPDPDRTAFIDELGRALEVASAHKSDAPVIQLLREWRATAEMHADPRLARRLARAITADGDRVPSPPEV